MIDRCEALASRLGEFGLSVEVAAGPETRDAASIVTLSRDSSRQEYRVVQVESMTMKALPAWIRRTGPDDIPTLVVGDLINPRSARTMSQSGYQYLDTSGNAHIAFGEVFVHVEGRTGPTPSTRHRARPAPGPVDLFSPKRSQVIFALLSWPELLRQPVRTIARAAGVSVGQTQSTLSLLESTGYVPQHGARRLEHREELIDSWVAAYGWGLGPSLPLREFRAEWPERPAGNWHAAGVVSGEAAVPEFLRASSLTLYVEQLSPELVIAHRWRTDGAANVFIRRKFWCSPTADSDTAGAPESLAPPLLIYADLLSAHDIRQSKAAQDFRRVQPGLQA